MTFGNQSKIIKQLNIRDIRHSSKNNLFQDVKIDKNLSHINIEYHRIIGFWKIF